MLKREILKGNVRGIAAGKYETEEERVLALYDEVVVRVLHSLVGTVFPKDELMEKENDLD